MSVIRFVVGLQLLLALFLLPVLGLLPIIEQAVGSDESFCLSASEEAPLETSTHCSQIVHVPLVVKVAYLERDPTLCEVLSV